MRNRFIIEKYVMEDHSVFNMGSSSCAMRHSAIVPKADIAGFLHYILPDVKNKKFDDYPYGESVAMAIKLALDNGKKHISFSNKDKKLDATLAKLVKDGVLKENWGNYEIQKSLPAPLVESFTVKILD